MIPHLFFSSIQALFFSLDGSTEMFNLYLVIPAVSARLLMGEEQVLAHLYTPYKTDFHLHDPHRLSPSECLLAATGPMSVLPAVISSLLAVFQYMAMPQLNSGPGLGGEQQQQRSVLDLPLNLAAQRYKRKTDQERADNRAARRAKNPVWRQPHRGEKAVT